MGYKHCNTGRVLKNKSHFVTIYEIILVSLKTFQLTLIPGFNSTHSSLTLISQFSNINELNDKDFPVSVYKFMHCKIAVNWKENKLEIFTLLLYSSWVSHASIIYWVFTGAWVTVGLLDSSQHSGWSQRCWSLDGLDFSGFQLFQSPFPNLWELFQVH